MARGGWAALYFITLSVAVWVPSLFQSGYVLLGDMVFTPAMHPPSSLLGPIHGTMDVTLVYNLAWLLSRVIGAMLLQKTILFLIVFLAGYLMYRNTPATHQWSRVFAGTLYAINPFLYTRLVMGQWGFLLGYALLPVIFASTIKTIRDPGASRIAKTALWLAGTAVLSLHAGAIGLLVAVTVGVFQLARTPKRRRALLSGTVVIVLFLLLSSFWLLPIFGGGSALGTIGKTDFKAFETRSTSSTGVGVSVVGLYGFWKTQIDALMPRKYVPLWPVFAFLLVLLCLYGLWRYWDEPGRGPGLGALALLAVVAFFLALGSRAPMTGSAFSLVFQNLAPLRMFREPQKFVALIVLAYSMLGAAGLDRFLSRRASSADEGAARRRTGFVVPVVLLALVCFYSFRMFGSLWGQARAVSYPKSWAQAQEYLQRDQGDWYALYLPDFWYMRYDFTGSDYTITDPMPLYFKNRSLPRSTIEIGPVRLDSTGLDDYLQASLASGEDHRNMGAMLAPLNVKYVLMSLNDASVMFKYVEHQRDLKIVRRWKDLVLLENEVPVSRLALVQTTGSFTTWKSAGRHSRGAVLTASYLPRGPTTLIPASRGRPVGYTQSWTGVISALLPASPDGSAAARTLLFSDPFSTCWRIEGTAGSTPREQLGVVTAFPVGAGGRPATVKITYNNVLLPLGYALTALALLLCAALVVRES